MIDDVPFYIDELYYENVSFLLKKNQFAEFLPILGALWKNIFQKQLL